MDDSARLSQINQLSHSGRGTWFGLLAVLVFVGITLMGHSDAAFFAAGAATKLPVINVDVPPTSFFLAAPVLLTAVFCYMHVFLLGLWDLLGDAPQDAGPEATPLADQVTPMVFSLAALWYRNRVRADGSMAPRVLGVWTVVIAILLGWIFGLVILAWLWWAAMPVHDPGMTLLAGACIWVAVMVAMITLRSARGRMRGQSRAALVRATPTQIAFGIVLVAAISLVSWERTEGGALAAARVPERMRIPLATADLREAELTRKPSDWEPFELWMRRQGAGPDTVLRRDSDIAKLWTNRLSALDAPNLVGRDLRGADLTGAFLPGADLREAVLEGAILSRADAQGANFRRSRLDGADFGFARLQGAVLSGINISNVGFHFAQMQLVSLFAGLIDDAEFSHARLDGADLGLASFCRTGFTETVLRGADLGEADVLHSSLKNADLRFADLRNLLAESTVLESADLSDATMEYSRFTDSSLVFAKIRSPDLEGVEFERSNLAGATLALTGRGDGSVEDLSLQGSFVAGADLRALGDGLTKEQIEAAFGDTSTMLPDRLLPRPVYWHSEDVPGFGLGGGMPLDLEPDYTREKYDAFRASMRSDFESFGFDVDAWQAWLAENPSDNAYGADYTEDSDLVPPPIVLEMPDTEFGAAEWVDDADAPEYADPIEPSLGDPFHRNGCDAFDVASN